MTIEHRLPARLRIGVVVSAYNTWITSALRDAALAELERSGGAQAEAIVVDAPGTFELPALAAELAATGHVHPIVALGCVIRGETTHYDHIARAAIDQLCRIACETGVPVGLGVLTVQSAEQAEARAGGPHGNKGAEAMEAALRSVGALGGIRHLAEALDAAPDAAGEQLV